jgi:hypothetical protein
MNVAFLCGEAGCAALGIAFIAAILFLVVLGWLYELWRGWANRYLEEVEQDIRRSRWLREMEENEPESSNEKAA